MALSGNAKWARTRDDIIGQALRKVNATATGETPPTALVTETAATLNNLLKALHAEGMPLWRMTEYEMTPTASLNPHTIGESGGTVTQKAPLKIVQAWRRTGSGTSESDIPLNVVSQYDYNLLPNKSTEGTPTHLFYKEPGANVATAALGSIYLWPVPDSTFVTTNTGKIVFVYQRPFDDLDAAGDHLDFPPNFYQAIVWLLAADIARDNGTPLAEDSMLFKRAMLLKKEAFDFNTEEGSLRFVPDQNYLMSLR